MNLRRISMKVCRQCEEEKNDECFRPQKRVCIECVRANDRERARKRRASDPDYCKYQLEYQRERRKNDPEFRQRQRDYSAARYYRERENGTINRQRRLEATKRWQARHPERSKEMRRRSCRKYRSTKEGKINTNIRWLVHYSLHSHGAVKSKPTFDALGWTTQELIDHLESQFSDGMSWDNYGEWHIDHIIPLKAFEFSSMEDEAFKQAWALSNLQPLWARDNVRKGARIEQPHADQGSNTPQLEHLK